MKDLASKGMNKMNNEENQSAEANAAATQTAAENPKAKWTDEQWFKVFRRASSVTARAGIGMGYQQIKGSPFPVDDYKKWEAEQSGGTPPDGSDGANGGDTNGDNGNTGDASGVSNADLAAKADATPVDLSPIDGYEAKTQGEMLGDVADAPKPSEDDAKQLFSAAVSDAVQTIGIKANTSVKQDTVNKAQLVISIEPDIDEEDEDKAQTQLSDVKAALEKMLTEEWGVIAVSFRDYYLGDGAEAIVTMPNGIEDFASFAQNMVYERAKREINACPPSFFIDTKSHFRQLRNIALERARFSDAHIFDLESGEEVEQPTEGFQVTFQTDEGETNGSPSYLTDEEYDTVVTRLMSATGAKPSFTKFGDTPSVSFCIADRSIATAIMQQFNQQSMVDWATFGEVGTEEDKQSEAEVNGEGEGAQGGENADNGAEGANANADANASASADTQNAQQQ